MEEHTKCILTGCCILICVIIICIYLPRLFPQLVTSDTPPQQLYELDNSKSCPVVTILSSDGLPTEVYELDDDCCSFAGEVVLSEGLTCYSCNNITVYFEGVSHIFRRGSFRRITYRGYTTSEDKGTVLIGDIIGYLHTLNPAPWSCYVNITGEYKGCEYIWDEWVIL